MDFSVYFFAANDNASFGERYRFILEVARYIDEHGFRAIWTPERHFQEFGGSFPNPSVLSAALAAVTSNLELRAGSVVVPHHHPVRIVEEWALVDQLSQGRVGLCVATGWHRGDFVFYPGNYGNRRELTFASVETIRALWRGEAVELPGVDGQPLKIKTYPRPCQPELPIWLVHSTNPEIWIKAGELGANVLSLLDNFDRLKANIASYRESLAAHGFDPASGTVTVAMHTYVGDDDVQVRRLVAEPVKQYLSTFLTQRKTDANLQGASKEVSESERELLSRLAFEDMYERRSLLGTLPKCIEVVRSLKGIGVDEVACLVDFGLSFDVVLGALPRLDALRAAFSAEPAPSTAGPMSWYYAR
ncbi:MupA/Atu3671 family FMN-dependent luciferase-like monooxygenase [Sorangium sp. So ce590]|uniref:MupA/Atu3671 family FMN-dependent luciferase-like monooxygenase n=1 Tax=unclassified Sorangium TaxID=2621164 RepID=UPI003F5F8D9B